MKNDVKETKKERLQTDMKQLQHQIITFTRLSDLTFDLDIRVSDTLSEVFIRCTYGISLKVLGDFQNLTSKLEVDFFGDAPNV